MGNFTENARPAQPFMTGAAYVRVSTNDQLELSPESQLREIFRYAEEHAIQIPESFIFMEKEGRSGKRAENRPEFQRMIALAKTQPRPFDVILVWKFSRFARNQDESTFYKGILRKKLGIDVLSISEPVLEGMYGRLIELIIEWQDEFYSYNLSTEVRRGMAENARKGGYQSALPYGYRHPGPGLAPAVDEEQANIVRLIFTEFADEKKELSSIARELNERGFTTKKHRPFESRTISYILKNPFYTGQIRWNRAPHGSARENPPEEIIVVKGNHEPVISRELFARAQDRFNAAGLIRRARDHGQPRFSSHYLSGLLKCPVCGANLSFNRTKTPYFQCWRYARGLHGGSASISEKKAVRALLASLKELEIFCLLPKGVRFFPLSAKEALSPSRETSSYSSLEELIASPSIPDSVKSDALRAVLGRIVYDRAADTFRFYYRKSDCKQNQFPAAGARG